MHLYHLGMGLGCLVVVAVLLAGWLAGFAVPGSVAIVRIGAALVGIAALMDWRAARGR